MCYAAMRWPALSTRVCRRWVTTSSAATRPPYRSLILRPPSYKLNVASPPVSQPLSARSCPSGWRSKEEEEGSKIPCRARFVAASLLTWLGLTGEREEPESELVLTIKRGILAARVSLVQFQNGAKRGTWARSH